MLKPTPQLDLAVLKTRALEEISRKPLETLTLIGGVLSVVVLGLLNLMVSRYLAVFGQPGLPAFGDGGSLLAGLVLTTLVVIFSGLIFISVPIFCRAWSEGFGEHLLSDAFSWHDEGGAGRKRAVQTYAALYGPLFACSLWICAMMFGMGWASPRWIWASLLVGLIVPALFILRTTPQADRGLAAITKALAMSLALSFIALIWLTVLILVSAQVLGPTFKDVSVVQGGLVGAAILTVLLLLHWVLTAAGRLRGAVFLLFLGLAAIILRVAPDDRLVTFVALRLANLGGGSLVFVRDTAAPPSSAPLPACLILSAGDTLILKLVKAADDCDDAAMRKTFATLIEADPDTRQVEFAKIRKLSRGDLFDQL